MARDEPLHAAGAGGPRLCRERDEGFRNPRPGFRLHGGRATLRRAGARRPHTPDLDDECVEPDGHQLSASRHRAPVRRSGVTVELRGATMGILTPEMKAAVNEIRLCFVATCSPDGAPNVSPKGS